MSPDDFEGAFIKAGDSETKGRLRVEVIGESLGSAPLWLPRKGVSLGRAAVRLLESQTERGSWRQDWGKSELSSLSCFSPG